jgi:putative oxidoreductase
MRQLFLLGRIIAGGYFVMSGVEHFMNLARLSRVVAAHGVPMPELAVVGAGVLLLLGGLSLLLGMVPRLGVAALVLFLVPVTFVMHRFWNYEGARRVAEMVNFTKNLALLGSVLMFLAIPEPWPYSARARIRHRRHAHI